jgi:hypothetical protein
MRSSLGTLLSSADVVTRAPAAQLTLLGCLRPALVPQPGFGASSLLSIYDLIERARPPHIHPCGKIAKVDDPQRADGRDENKEECRWRQVALQDRENGYIGRAACC